mmetsp:Transcript_51832/g.108310  ORF Transcript_51832/g.108310 Transcript_51832/m.108310 type:complete len:209 (-) Transcript_51832:39-665(-)
MRRTFCREEGRLGSIGTRWIPRAGFIGRFAARAGFSRRRVRPAGARAASSTGARAGAVRDDGRREQGHQRRDAEAQVLLLLHGGRCGGAAGRLRPGHRVRHHVVHSGHVGQGLHRGHHLAQVRQDPRRLGRAAALQRQPRQAVRGAVHHGLGHVLPRDPRGQHAGPARQHPLGRLQQALGPRQELLAGDRAEAVGDGWLGFDCCLTAV